MHSSIESLGDGKERYIGGRNRKKERERWREKGWKKGEEEGGMTWAFFRCVSESVRQLYKNIFSKMTLHFLTVHSILTLNTNMKL